MDNMVEKQHFISGCKCSTFMEEQMRRKRDVPAYQHKFTTNSLLVTINGYLELPNSPAKRPASTRIHYNAENQLMPRQTTMVHGLNTYMDIEHSHYSDSIPDNEDHTLDPNNDIGFAFHMACNTITSNPTANFNKPCLVCTVLNGTPPNDGHWFKTCPVLNDHLLLKDQFKGMCRLIMHGRNFNKSAAIRRTNAISFEADGMDSDRSVRTGCEDSPPDSPQSDFLQGHS